MKFNAKFLLQTKEQTKTRSCKNSTIYMSLRNEVDGFNRLMNFSHGKVKTSEANMRKPV